MYCDTEEWNGERVSTFEVKREVLDHYADWDEFIAEFGHHNDYDAGKVLAWLGY